MRKQISSGAESIVFLNDAGNIEKNRVPKNYRITEIDGALRKSRIKRELKVLNDLKKTLLPIPNVIRSNDSTIEMEYIRGTQIKKVLDRNPLLAVKIGENLSIMHNNGIIHGDLTTSNMILNDVNIKKLYFIDFGLSFYSKKLEDKAVDIHLFRQALESKHFKVSNEAFESFLTGYNPENKKEILERLKAVERRGRNKEKI